MGKKFLILTLALCLFLSGCGWLDGSYVSVTPHQEQRSEPQNTAPSVSNYSELVRALEDLVSAGRESSTILVPQFPSEDLSDNVTRAVRYIKTGYPIGAYAVEDMDYELGTGGAVPAVAVTVTYRRSLTEIQRIRQLKTMDAAEVLVREALKNCDASTVLLIGEYAPRDMTQFVQDYAAAYPQTVMETPQVTETVYGTGDSRVLELIYTYQHSREELRKMQSQVQPVFNSAVLYVSGDGAERQKFSQLYAFLMERFDYKLETSLTPAYSLLRHGVGDSRAFASVYAAMCRDAGLECLTVTGTCAGEPRTWNIIRDGERYFHLDLLRCRDLGFFRPSTDDQMDGYVWDYSAYPACAPIRAAQSETPPSDAAPEETEAATQPVTEETVPTEVLTEATEAETMETIPTEIPE